MWNVSLDHALDKWASLNQAPGWSQWGILAAYILCIWLCFVCGRAAQQNKEHSTGWFIAAGLLCLLAAENMLHASELFIFFMRDLATSAGWYEQRRHSQSITIGIAVFVGLCGLAWLRHRLSESWHLHGNVVMGMSVLIVLTFLRVISLHDVDSELNTFYLGISLDRAIEIAGLAMVLYGVIRKLQTI
jgi:hypothetical protein